MHNEAEREQALEAFQQVLACVLDAHLGSLFAMLLSLHSH